MQKYKYKTTVTRCNDLEHPTKPTPEEFRVGSETVYESEKFVADGQYKKVFKYDGGQVEVTFYVDQLRENNQNLQQ